MNDKHIAVVGLGYVGLPLAVSFCDTGLHFVCGLDTDSAKVNILIDGRSYIDDVPDEKIELHTNGGAFFPTDNPIFLQKADIIFICVPTPYTRAKEPDLSFVKSAAHSVGQNLRRGQMVILQSTSFPGTTFDVVGDILSKESGLTYHKDFDMAFVPERINPGGGWDINDVPKVVGCHYDCEWERVKALFDLTGTKTVCVSSPNAAEMVKLLENTFRAVNIALVNELAVLCERVSLNLWEIVAAASTKPYGFMPFYPGPGVGGHCIPIDPYYLSYYARTKGMHLNSIEFAMPTNESMPKHVLNLLYRLAGEQGLVADPWNTIFFGATYKANVKDTRESPYQAILEVSDTKFPCFDPLTGSRSLEDALARCEIAVILINHPGVDYQKVIDSVDLVIDCCNATKGLSEKGKVYLLGRGF